MLCCVPSAGALSLAVLSQRGASMLRPLIGANSPILIKPVLVNCANTSSPSLLLCLDQSRYLFNCPKNTSCLFVQSRIPQKNLNTAGTYGMLMGSANGNKQSVQLIGPEGLHYMLACGRLFTRRQGMTLNLTEFQTTSILKQVFQDNLIGGFAIGNDQQTIQAHTEPVVIKNRKCSPDLALSSDVPLKGTKLDPINTDLPAGVQPAVTNLHNGLPKILDNMFRASGAARTIGKNATPAHSYQRLHVPNEPINTDPVPYLVLGPRLQGKFLPDKAKRLGVKPGPDFAKLVNGESVQVNEETIVMSEMCLEGGSAGPVFFISGITSLEQLDQTTFPESSYISGVSDGAKLLAVYHLVHENVVINKQYTGRISKFGSDVTLLAPGSFPIPYYSLEPAIPSLFSPQLNLLSRHETFSFNSSKTTLEHLSQLDYSIFGCLDRSELVSRLKNQPELADQLESLESIDYHSMAPTGEAGFVDQIIVTTLGSGSASPSKYRNGTYFNFLHLSGFVLLLEVL
ncbi:hypothetical protein MJO28_013379 [Puccinia striiformis f. sp. tritici]|uniref:Uncharacterized protein n=1 Tax=Puccinia striiformis f. sp. tritici TaxID=168172 RepID=A0ACC0DYF5_9BASI|nr:hypothetical protein MJO28_013379 [Puccinia striiformis f. sp. tritici]